MALVAGPDLRPLHFVRGDAPLDTWIALVKLVAAEGQRTGDKRKLFSTIAVVNSPASLSEAVIKRHSELAGPDPWKRTERLYTTLEDLSWKRSYRARITVIKEGGRQLSDAVALLASRPGTSSACCVIARPEDLRRARVIASTVPCPIAFDLKSDDGLLNMTVLFRAGRISTWSTRPALFGCSAVGDPERD